MKKEKTVTAKIQKAIRDYYKLLSTKKFDN